MQSSWKAGLVLGALGAISPSAAGQSGVELIAIEEAQVLASDAAPSDQFGAAVALSGDLAVIGAPLEDHAGLFDSGAAYIFARSGTDWIEEAKLTASDGAPGDGFGSAVAIDGTTIVVGAPLGDGGATGAGAAYVFVKNGTVWNEEARLTAGDATTGDGFGESVALDGDTAIVGAQYDDDVYADDGSAYVFRRSGTAWGQEAKLTAIDPGPETTNRFGAAVDVSGDSALVGAFQGDAPSAFNSGAAYVYVRSGTSWSHEAKLTASTAMTNGHFGAAVALDGDRALIGAYGRARAHVFERVAGTWTEGAELGGTVPVGSLFGFSVDLRRDLAVVGAPLFGQTNPGAVFLLVRDAAGWRIDQVQLCDLGSGDQLGYDVALTVDRLLIGAPLHDAAASNAGAAWSFSLRSPAVVFESAVLTVPEGDGFGFGAAVDGNTILAGEPGDDDGGTNAGAAWVFTRSGTTWSSRAKLTASDAARGDLFGESLDLDGTTALIGAHGAGTTGAAYIFEGGGSSWSERAKLLPSGSSAQFFGASVALDGDTALVGSPNEDEPHTNAGAAYVFVRSGTTWIEQARLVASDPVANAHVGRSVALQGETLVLGTSTFNLGWAGVYVFVRTGTTWTQQAKLTLPPGTRGESLSVAFENDRLLVGSPFDYQGCAFAVSAGSAFVFARSGASWTQEAVLIGLGSHPGARFGGSVALSGHRALVATWPTDSADPGSIFVFARSDTTWLQQPKLIPSPSALGSIGRLDVDGDTVVSSTGSYNALVYSLDDLFPSFCDASDGALASCPCSNPGAPDSGCDIAASTGGVRLNVVAQSITPQNRATLRGTGFAPMATPGVLAIRSSALEPAPVVLGDGLRCLGLPIARLTGTLASGGVSQQEIIHGPMSGSGLFYYQLWFRDQPAMFCTPAAFNLSNGRTLTW